MHVVDVIHYPPLNQRGEMAVSPEVYDILFYGGYLYAAGLNALSIYDLTEGTWDLKNVIQFKGSGYIPRLYRWKNQLIISYYVDEDDNGLLFYDISTPIQPQWIKEFHPHDVRDEYIMINSGFPNECRSTCKVVNDLLICNMEWYPTDPYPCTFYGSYVPFVIDLKTMKTLDIWMLDTGWNCDWNAWRSINQSGFEYFEGNFLFQQGQGHCKIPGDFVSEAFEDGLSSTRYCSACYYFCEGCPLAPITRYKTWLMFGSAGYFSPQPLMDKMKAGVTLGGEFIYIEPYSCTLDQIWFTPQDISGHEDWVYSTDFECQRVANYDPETDSSNSEFAGVNVMDQPLYRVKVLNNVVYVTAENRIYMFDPVHFDEDQPVGDVTVCSQGPILRFAGSVQDEDGIASVSVRIGDELMASYEFTDPYYLPHPLRREHERPFDLHDWTVTIDTALLTPGTYSLKTVAVDWEGSFSVIEEREIEIGSTKFKSDIVPMDRETKLIK